MDRRVVPGSHADAKPDPTLGIWLVSYRCWDCRTEHHYGGGPTTSPPRGGMRRTPCNRWVEVKVTVKRT